MTAFSAHLETQILNAVLRNIPYTSPNPVFVGLYTTWGVGDAPGTEVAGGSYARTAASFTVPDDGSCTNAGPSALAFPIATTDWGTITHFALFDDDTLGNVLFHAALTTPIVVGSGDTAQFPPGTLKVTLR